MILRPYPQVKHSTVMYGQKNQIIERFLEQLAQTANAKDHVAHMALVSKDLRVLGVPGFAALGYDDWYKQCAHEFEENILKSVTFEFLRMRAGHDTQHMFIVKEVIEANDGTVVEHTAEMLIELEPDGKWRLRQERILSAEEIDHLLK